MEQHTGVHEVERTTGAPTATVVSPEQVQLEMPLAGPSSRMLAYAIDYVILLLVMAGLFVTLLWLAPFAELVGDWIDRLLPGDTEPGGDVGAAWLIGFFVLLYVVGIFGEILYFVASELSFGGRSIGKRAVGLRVVREGGLPIGPRESLIRNLLRIVDALPSSYLIGLASVVISERAQRLGDMAAGTLVVRLDRDEPSAPEIELDDPALARFRFDRTQLARIGPAELRLARQTLRRLPSLPPERAEAVLERAAGALALRMGYEGLPPVEREDFLRAVLRARRRG